MSELPVDVANAAEHIRLSLREQEARCLDSFGTALGPGSPRPSREDLLVVLRHLGVADDIRDPGSCGDPLELWDVTTYCARPSHAVNDDDRHRNRYGTEWTPTNQ